MPRSETLKAGSCFNFSCVGMEERELYDLIFAPVIASLGAFDARRLTAIVGFWAGGPISLLTIGRERKEPFVTYITCELAVREDQMPSDIGHYELLITCDDEDWAWTVLAKVSQLTTDTAFGSGHTLDISPWVGEDDPLQGLAFEELCRSVVGDENCAVFRLHGLTRDELNSAVQFGVIDVLERRKRDGVYPRTHVPEAHKRLVNRILLHRERYVAVYRPNAPDRPLCGLESTFP